MRDGSIVLTTAIVVLSVGSLTQRPAGAHDGTSWPSFRGPGASGVVEGAALPEEWDLDADVNVSWRTPIPGLGHSSPVVWGGRVFVTTAVRLGGESELSSLYGSPGYGADRSMQEEGEHSFRVFCLDRETGEVLWEREAHRGAPAIKRHVKSSHANPTPACDAERVVVFFASEGLHCYDHDGEFLWSRDLGRLDSGAPDLDDWKSYEWGYASSPVLHDDRVIIQCDVQEQSYLAAFDATDGSDVWRTDRDERPTWGTPTVHEMSASGRPQVIVNGYQHGGGYDLETGDPIWWFSGGGDSPVPTPVISHGLVFLTSAHGRGHPLTAFRVTAEGELRRDAASSEHVEWNLPRRGIYMQTPIVYGDLLYCCSDGGILSCYDARTGEEMYRQRLGLGRAGFSGSAVAGDGKLYFTSETGRVFVVKAGPEYELVAANELGETCLSTPAVADGLLLFRTRHHVVAVGR